MREVSYRQLPESPASHVEGKRVTADAERKGDVLEITVRLKLLPGERYTGPVDIHIKEDSLDACYCRDGGKARTV